MNKLSKVCLIANSIISNSSIPRPQAFKKAWEVVENEDLFVIRFQKKGETKITQRVVCEDFEKYHIFAGGPTKNPYRKFVDIGKALANIFPAIIAPANLLEILK